MKSLVRYSWPGNVRELEHVVERAVTLASHAILSVDDLPPAVLQNKGVHSNHAAMFPGTLKALQREQVLKMLESTHGNKERTARLLGISRRTLYRLLERYEAETIRPSGESDTQGPVGS
jgi:DNA-binding NtrC family response regulator